MKWKELRSTLTQISKKKNGIQYSISFQYQNDFYVKNHLIKYVEVWIGLNRKRNITLLTENYKTLYSTELNGSKTNLPIRCISKPAYCEVSPPKQIICGWESSINWYQVNLII